MSIVVNVWDSDGGGRLDDEAMMVDWEVVLIGWSRRRRIGSAASSAAGHEMYCVSGNREVENQPESQDF